MYVIYVLAVSVIFAIIIIIINIIGPRSKIRHLWFSSSPFATQVWLIYQQPYLAAFWKCRIPDSTPFS